MRKIIISAFIIFGFGLQAQDLPVPSPACTLDQRVGLTDIKIEYSRPGVKDRTVFGELVPYGEVWRTGANKVPNLTFSTDVNFGGTNVEAGTYALLTIPQEESWIIMLNSETEMWGTGNYDEAKNVAMVESMPTSTEFTETFTIDINDIRNSKASLVLRWEKTEVKVPLEVEVHPIAVENIAIAIEESDEEAKWRVYRNAAGYYFNSKQSMDKALEYITQSVKENPDSWYSHWLHAEILAEQNDYKAAIKAAKESMKVGETTAKKEETEFGYSDMIEEAIDNWKEMKNS